MAEKAASGAAGRAPAAGAAENGGNVVLVGHSRRGQTRRREGSLAANGTL